MAGVVARSDLLEMQNPTCDLRTYRGGQIACHHMRPDRKQAIRGVLAIGLRARRQTTLAHRWSLLDADQEIPWRDQPLEYSLKFRFWVPYLMAGCHMSC